LDELAKLLNGQAETAQKFLICQEQVPCQGSVNLGEYGVFRITDKGFTAQILLDFPEENLNPSAFFVHVGKGFGDQPEVVG